MKLGKNGVYFLGFCFLQVLAAWGLGAKPRGGEWPKGEGGRWTGDGGWGRECLLLGGIVGMEWLYVTLGMGGPGEAFWLGLYRKEIFQSFG